MLESNIFTLGVTGGIGSGKSLVCKMFEELGARVIYADAEAKKMMVGDVEVVKEIRETFGSESYFEDGSLNRAHLASVVFGDDEAVAMINGIVHPRMAGILEAAKAEAARDGIAVLVYEAALIYESGSAARVDAVAVVHAPLEARIKRVMARDEVSEEQVKERMQHQLPSEELLDRADYIITNDGSLETLQSRVEALYEQITKG